MDVNQYNSVFQGYNDCASNTLYYLTHIEGLPINHPMVVGLHQHLLQQRAIMEQNMACGNWHPVGHPIYQYNMPKYGYYNTNSHHVANQMHLIKDTSELSANDNMAPVHPVHMPSQSSNLVQTHAHNHISQQTNTSGADGENKPDIHQTQLQEADQDVTTSSSTDDVEGPLQLPDMHMLAMLSKDNHQVAQLTQELIMLLAEEELENSGFLENNE